jgi:outer membrane protein TolC
VLAGCAIGLAQPAAPADAPPVTLDFAGALQRARDYNQQFMQAKLAGALAREDRVQARAGMLPTLTAVNQYIWTQANGTDTGIYVAGNGVNVYTEQATLHADLFSYSKLADYRRALADEAAAKARVEIGARGLITAVAQSYYALVVAQRHETNARGSLGEAKQFLELTRKQERGGEVAHADVVKAQLLAAQRERDLRDAAADTQKARVALAVMVFPDPLQAYSVVDDLNPDAPLAAYSDLQTLAQSTSPEVRAAEHGVKSAMEGIESARGAYYPTLSLDYWYGLNGNSFAARTADGHSLLGSSIQGTMTFPVWNWGATQSKVRQAELQHRQAQFDLRYTQRGLQAALGAAYVEAQTARQQLASLKSSAGLAAESLRLTLLRYEAGEALALEVSDAQSTLTQARDAYDDGLGRYRLALAALQTLTGRL